MHWPTGCASGLSTPKGDRIMQRHRSITKLFLALSAVLLTAALAPSTFAQNQPSSPAPAAQQVYWVTVTKVKPEMANEYVEFLKNETLPAYKKGGGKAWATWTTTILGEGGEYWLVRPLDSLKQFDEPSFLVKALGEAGTQAWAAKRAKLIVSSRSFLITARPDLSVAPKTNEAPKIGVGARTSVTPGRDADYVKGLKELVSVVGKTNAKGVLVSKVGLGGDPNEYIALVLFDSFADIEAFFQSFVKAAAEAKLAPAAAGVAAHTEWAVYRYVPELSIQPPPMKAENK
jgi:hypothetical protein